VFIKEMTTMMAMVEMERELSVNHVHWLQQAGPVDYSTIED